MTEQTDDHDDALLTEARARLENVAAGLLRRFDPVPVASSFVAIGSTILATYLGTPRAAEFLRELAASMEEDEETAGHG